METHDSILQFWFGSEIDDKTVAEQRSKLWWSKDPQVDDEIRRRFEPCLARASDREMNSWLATPRGRLASILLTDQFPRHIHRDTPQAFAFDPLAHLWCKEGIGTGADKSLRPIERVFFYLPLEHSECMEDQDRSLALFQALVEDADPEHRQTFDGFLRFAVRHRDIIKRFGRFPHRNRILGRELSPEELAFLNQKGSSF
jgi:uncharacterized protein (DUF924 family)